MIHVQMDRKEMVKEVNIHWETVMGQAVLSQCDYTHWIVERCETGRGLERFGDKFPREKPQLNSILWIWIQVCLTSTFEPSSI